MARGVSPSPQVLSRGNTAASASTTSAPPRAAQAAAADPAGPAPTTRTSVDVGRVLTVQLSQVAGCAARAPRAIGPSAPRPGPSGHHDRRRKHPPRSAGTCQARAQWSTCAPSPAPSAFHRMLALALGAVITAIALASMVLALVNLGSAEPAFEVHTEFYVIDVLIALALRPVRRLRHRAQRPRHRLGPPAGRAGLRRHRVRPPVRLARRRAPRPAGVRRGLAAGRLRLGRRRPDRHAGRAVADRAPRAERTPPRRRRRRHVGRPPRRPLPLPRPDRGAPPNPVTGGTRVAEARLRLRLVDHPRLLPRRPGRRRPPRGPRLPRRTPTSAAAWSGCR